MAKDPAFLFYPNDWIGGTMGMSFEQKGAYLELLIFQFNNGKFTAEQANNVLRTPTIFHALKSKFKTDGNLFWNDRLDMETQKRKAYTESRRNNRMNNHMIDHMIDHMSSHMENENERLKLVKDKLKKEMEPFAKKYPVELLNKFFSYWTEPNKSKTKLRYELEKTWEVGRRLATWSNNNSKWDKNDFSNEPKTIIPLPPGLKKHLDFKKKHE